MASAGIGIFLFLPITYFSEILHVNYDPVGNTVSQLLIGPGSTIAQAGFFMVGLFIIAFTIGIYFCIQTPVRKTFYAGLVLMLVIGIASFAIAFTPPESEKYSGVKHVLLAATAMGSFPVACLLLIAQFYREGWRNIVIYTLFTALAGAGLCIAYVCTSDRWLGLVERLLIGNGILWFGIVGLYTICRIIRQGLKDV